MATTTTPLDRLRDAIDDLHRALRDIEHEMDTLEFGKPDPDARICDCRHPKKWHKRVNDMGACQTPDCPCRKFEPAGGDA